jgi:hypothetical protein
MRNVRCQLRDVVLKRSTQATILFSGVLA